MAEQRVIYIVIDPSKARSGASSVVNSLRSIEGATGRVNTQLRASDRAMASFAKNFGRLQAVLLAAQPVRFLSGFLRELVAADKVVTTFKSQMYTVTGDINEAGEAFEYLKKTAQAYAVPLNSITKGYAKLRASMDFDHLRKYNEELFQSTVILSSVLHMAEYNTERVFNVMIQIMSKGQLMMEELKQQLGEHVPGAITLAAESMGYTVERMMELMQKGEISAEEFASGWSTYIIERFGPAVEMSTKSIQASINRFKNVIQESMIEMSQSEAGFAISQMILAVVGKLDSASDYFKTFGIQVAEVALDVKDFIDALTPEDIERFFTSMIRLVEAFFTFLSFIGRSILFLTEYSSEVGTAAKVTFGSVVAFKAYNAAAAIMVASTKAASMWVTRLGQALGILMGALSVIGAGFVGWSIGSWLYDEYLLVRQAGNRIAKAVHWMVAKLSQNFEMMGLKIKLAFTEPFDYAMQKAAKFLRFLNMLGEGVLDFMGIDFDTSKNGISALANFLDSGDAGRISSQLEALSSKHEKEITRIKDTYDDLFDLLDEDSEGKGDVNDRLGFSEDQLAKYKKMQEELQAIFGDSEKFKKAESAAEEFDKKMKSLRESVEDIRNELDPLGKEFEDLYKKKDLLHMATAYDIISPQERDKMIKGLVEAMQEGGEDAAEEFINPFEDAAERLSDSISDAIVSGDWASVGEALGNTLAGGVAGIFEKQAGEWFSSAFGEVTKDSGLFMQIGSAFAGPLAGAVGGALAQVAFNEIADMLSGSDWDPTEARQAAQGTGTLLGAIDEKSQSIANSVDLVSQTNEQLVNINTGMLRALSDLQLGISSAVAMVLRENGSGVNAKVSGNNDASDFFGGIAPILGKTTDLVVDFFDGAIELFTFGLVDGFIGDALGSVFGGSQKVVDRGIKILGGQLTDLVNETVVQAYATIKEDGGWFGSDKKFDKFKNVATNQFTLAFASIWETIEKGALSLGMLPEEVQSRLNEFVVKTERISLEGLNPQEQQEEIEAVFSTIFDDLAGHVVPFLGRFQRAGEGLGETLSRVATQVGLLDEALLVIGNFLSPLLSAENYAAIANGLSEMLGGTEEFGNAIMSFEDNFLTDADKIESMSRRLSSALGDLPLPETKQGFADLAAGQALQTREGRENLATLLRVQGVANEYYDLLESRQEEANRLQEEALQRLRDSSDAALSALEKSVNAERDKATKAYDAEREAIQGAMDARLEANRMATDAAREGLNAIEQEVNGLQSALDKLRDAFDPLQEVRRQGALELLRDSLSTGDLTGVGEASQRAAEIEGSAFSTLADFQREQGQTLHLLEDIEDMGKGQLTTAERALQRLEAQTQVIRSSGDAQLAALKQGYEAEMARLDMIITNAQEQLNVLRGIDNSIMSLAQALRAFEAAAGREKMGGTVLSDNTSQIDKLYASIGRDTDQVTEAEKDYWRAHVDKYGDSNLRDTFWTAAAENNEPALDEYSKNAEALLGFANGGDHKGGLRMVGERGPEIEGTGPSSIMSSEDLKQSFSYNKQMHQELRAMREDLKNANRALVKSNEKQRELLQRWDQVGLPEERTFV